MIDNRKWKGGDYIAPSKKDKQQKRRNVISIKLTDAELDVLTQSAEKANLSRSDYVRNLLLNKRVTIKYEVVMDVKEIKELVNEYGKIGSNLNQIAKYFNSGGERSLAIEDEIRQCISDLFSLRKEVLKLAGDFNGNHKTYQKPKR